MKRPTNSTTLPSFQESVTEKAKASKAYHMSLWATHINQLGHLVSHEPGGLSFEAWKDLQAQLLAYAADKWEASK